MTGILSLFKGGLEMAWKAFIRPPRYEYTDYDLGYTKFEEKGVDIERIDFEVLN